MSAFFPSSVVLPVLPQDLCAWPHRWAIKCWSWNHSFETEIKKNKGHQERILTSDCNTEINSKEKTKTTGPAELITWITPVPFLPISPPTSQFTPLKPRGDALAPQFSWGPTSPIDDYLQPRGVEQSHEMLPVTPDKLHQELQPTHFH